MKKFYLIILLIVVNFSLLYVKIFSNKLKKIDLNLKEGDLGIIILSLNSSKSLLLHKDDSFLLYTFQYEDDKDLESNISLFTDKVEYVFMNQEYSLSYPYKNVLDGLVVIQGIQLEPNRLHYQNQKFCINEDKNCDFVYLTKEMDLKEDISVVFYDENLSDSYIEKLHEKWIDVYKVTNNGYTILVLNEDYEVIQLVR